MTIPHNFNPLGLTKSEEIDPNALTFTAEAANSTITLNKTGNPITNGIKYKIGKKPWVTYKIGTILTLKNIELNIKLKKIVLKKYKKIFDNYHYQQLLKFW